MPLRFGSVGTFGFGRGRVVCSSALFVCLSIRVRVEHVKGCCHSAPWECGVAFLPECRPCVLKGMPTGGVLFDLGRWRGGSLVESSFLDLPECCVLGVLWWWFFVVFITADLVAVGGLATLTEGWGVILINCRYGMPILLLLYSECGRLALCPSTAQCWPYLKVVQIQWCFPLLGCLGSLRMCAPLCCGPVW